MEEAVREMMKGARENINQEEEETAILVRLVVVLVSSDSHALLDLENRCDGIASSG